MTCDQGPPLPNCHYFLPLWWKTKYCCWFTIQKCSTPQECRPFCVTMGGRTKVSFKVFWIIRKIIFDETFSREMLLQSHEISPRWPIAPPVVAGTARSGTLALKHWSQDPGYEHVLVQSVFSCFQVWQLQHWKWSRTRIESCLCFLVGCFSLVSSSSSPRCNSFKLMFLL